MYFVAIKMGRRQGARSRLEKQPTDFRQNICYFGDRTLIFKRARSERILVFIVVPNFTSKTSRSAAQAWRGQEEKSFLCP
jgi:hypothetical protein